MNLDEIILPTTTTVKFQKLNPEAQLPEYATRFAAGMDVRSLQEVTLPANSWMLVRTGLAMELEPGYECQVRSRSGLALNNGVVVLNSPGTIDSDYRGEIGVILYNLSNEPVTLAKGAKIAQLVINKYEPAYITERSNLSDTSRGSGGFGSTGV